MLRTEHCIKEALISKYIHLEKYKYTDVKSLKLRGIWVA